MSHPPPLFLRTLYKKMSFERNARRGHSRCISVTEPDTVPCSKNEIWGRKRKKNSPLVHRYDWYTFISAPAQHNTNNLQVSFSITPAILFYIPYSKALNENTRTRRCCAQGWNCLSINRAWWCGTRKNRGSSLVYMIYRAFRFFGFGALRLHGAGGGRGGLQLCKLIL
jgi:hypothetical protein